MAQRRMFSLKVIDTDLFLEMPISTRLLYFDFGMRADDDGFVSCPKKIIKMTSASEDDFKVLCSKQFIIPFESGVCIIKHWHIHNLIRHDRYTETECKEERKRLTKIDNKYELNIGMTSGMQKDVKRLPQVRIGKVRLGKVRLDKDIIYSKYGELNNVLLTEDQHKKLIEEYGKSIITKYINSLSLYAKINKYKDHNLTIRSWLNKDDIAKLKNEIIDENHPLWVAGIDNN